LIGVISRKGGTTAGSWIGLEDPNLRGSAAGPAWHDQVEAMRRGIVEGSVRAPPAMVDRIER
jgi:hypothetical protein